MSSSFSLARPGRFARHRVTAAVLVGIEWWWDRLSQPWCGLHLKKPPAPSPHMIFVDTSTSWGIGLVIDGQWQAWQLVPGWKGNSHSIGWAEMVAIKSATRTVVAMGLRDLHPVFRSDNMPCFPFGQYGCGQRAQSRSLSQNATEHITSAHCFAFLFVQLIPFDRICFNP